MPLAVQNVKIGHFSQPKGNGDRVKNHEELQIVVARQAWPRGCSGRLMFEVQAPGKPRPDAHVISFEGLPGALRDRVVGIDLRRRLAGHRSGIRHRSDPGDDGRIVVARRFGFLFDGRCAAGGRAGITRITHGDLCRDPASGVIAGCIGSGVTQAR